MNSIRNEPVIVGLLSLIAATIALLVAFGVALTQLQISAILHFFEALLIVGLLIRNKVSPVKP